MPDIITLDILMPGMDGIEVLKKIREQDSLQPVIMLTAYDYRDDFKWAYDAYIVKSADLTKLKYTIDKLILEQKQKNKG